MSDEKQKNPPAEDTKVEDNQLDVSQQILEKDKQIEDLQKELSGLKNKEFNYKKLRDMTEEEKNRLSTYEKELIDRQERLETQQNQFKDQVVQQHKTDAFAVFAGNNEELWKEMDFHFARLPEDAVTKDEIAKKAKDAYLLATGGKAPVGTPEQLSRVMGSYMAPDGGNKRNAELTQTQKDLAKNLGITEDELKKLN
jgi:hypothetical protein